MKLFKAGSRKEKREIVFLWYFSSLRQFVSDIFQAVLFECGPGRVACLDIAAHKLVDHVFSFLELGSIYGYALRVWAVEEILVKCVVSSGAVIISDVDCSVYIPDSPRVFHELIKGFRYSGYSGVESASERNIGALCRVTRDAWMGAATSHHWK